MGLRDRPGVLTRLMLAVTVVLALVGCGGSEPEEANPASVFCIEQGGEVDIVAEAGGQAGYCELPDGTRIDEWEYYRQNAPTTQP